MNVPIPVNTSEGLVSAGGATDAKLFNSNPGRTYLAIFNNHATQDLWIRFGTGAAAVGTGFKIAAGANKEFPAEGGLCVPADEVHVIGSGAGTTMYAVEGLGRKIA